MSSINTTNAVSEIKDSIESLDIDIVGDSSSFTLISNDGQQFTVSRKIAKMSGLVSTALSDKDKDAEATSIIKSKTQEIETDLPVNVKSEELALVIEYMKHHNGVERDPENVVDRPLKSKIMAENVKDPWDATFIDKLGKNPENADDVIRLADAANYLQIVSLLHLASSKMASLIKGEPIEKMKKLLEIEDDEEKKNGEDEDEESDDETDNDTNNNNTANATDTITNGLNNLKIKDDEKKQ